MNRLEIVTSWRGVSLANPEFLIDGKRFFDVFPTQFGGFYTYNNASWGLSPFYAKEALVQCRNGGPGDFDSGRIALVGRCLLCGDLGCGAFSVRVSIGDWSVVWSEFNWENSLGDAYAVDDAFQLEFLKDEYLELLNDWIARY